MALSRKELANSRHLFVNTDIYHVNVVLYYKANKCSKNINEGQEVLNRLKECLLKLRTVVPVWSIQELFIVVSPRKVEI